MKVTELMIGDWIIVNDIDHPKPMQVDGIYKKNGAYYAILSCDKTYCNYERIINRRKSKSL